MRRIDAACLRALSMEDVVALATQEGFAGRLVRHGRVFEWIRWLDYQPQSAVKDRATLAWHGDVLVETGHHAAYVEHWHRDRGRPSSTWAFRLYDPAAARAAILVVAPDRFAFARERAMPLAAGRPLRDLVLSAPTLAVAQDVVDCEISYGALDGWIIERSTLPWRGGTRLNVHRVGASVALDDIDPDGRPCRRTYDILAEETS